MRAVADIPPEATKQTSVSLKGISRGLGVVGVVLLACASPLQAAPEGQVTWTASVSIAPTWFDPAESPGIVTPFVYLFALHDALVRPMPGNPMAPSLAESWTVSKDGLTYEFVLRKGVLFHNGDSVTAEDVKFSFERYKGAAAKLLKDRVREIRAVDPLRVRFSLKEPWPDFMTFYATPATGAAWIVPKAYVQKVGDDGFKKAPVGAGPYRFVSFTPGVELVLEANDRYWRKVPNVKRLVFRVITDEATRVAMLRKGEADYASNLLGPLAEDVKRTPGLRLAVVHIPATFWIDFAAEQWDPKSPWADRRVRLAAALAIDRKGISQAETLGFSKIASSIVPSTFDFYWTPPPYPYDPVQAKKLLTEAGYPHGFDAGDYSVDAAYASLGEAVSNYLRAVGIRTKVRPLECAAFIGQWREKKIRNILQGGAGGLGNAATRVENYMISRTAFVYGTYPEMEDLFVQQDRELNRTKREAILHQIQRVAYEKVMFAPIFELAFLVGVGPRLEEPALGLIDHFPTPAPWEDVRLKRQ
jgi:peptide/nickel transport system substrate-binding protein